MKYYFTKLLFTISLLILSTTALKAGDTSLEGDSDWPFYQFNGQHTGHNVNDKISLPLELKWQRRYQVDNFEFNPAIIVGDRIVVTQRRINGDVDLTMNIRCLDIFSGDIIWENGVYDVHSIDPPIYYDGFVYCQVQRAGGLLYAINFDDGSVEWRLSYSGQHNKHLGPVIENNRILFMTGTYGGMTVADAKTGEVFWWKTSLPDYDIQAPAAYNNNVYLWSLNALTVWAVDTQELVWHKATWIPVTSSDVGGGPAIDTTDKIVFLGGQYNVFAIDMVTHEIIWTNDHPYHTLLSLNFNIEIQGLTPAIFEDKVYYINQDSLYCCNKFTGENVWKYGTDTLFWSPPVIANGLLFVASKDSTFAFDLVTQEKVWSFPVGGQIAVGNNHLVLGSIEGELYVFGRVATDIGENLTDNLPKGYELSQNYPNPFNPVTNIDFTIPQKSHVTIDIINIAGQKVRTLTNQTYSAGNYSVTWDSKDDEGNQLSSGIYLYRLKTDGITLKKKMVLLK